MSLVLWMAPKNTVDVVLEKAVGWELERERLAGTVSAPCCVCGAAEVAEGRPGGCVSLRTLEFNFIAIAGRGLIPDFLMRCLRIPKMGAGHGGTCP